MNIKFLNREKSVSYGHTYSNLLASLADPNSLFYFNKLLTRFEKIINNYL
jgi:hypothetical protein